MLTGCSQSLTYSLQILKTNLSSINNKFYKKKFCKKATKKLSQTAYLGFGARRAFFFGVCMCVGGQEEWGISCGSSVVCGSKWSQRIKMCGLLLDYQAMI